MSTDEVICWNCGADLAGIPRPISRHEQCPDCFEALHCCRLCRHFRTGATGSCAEERADPPVIKENANFCDWFQPTAAAFSGDRTIRSDAAKGRLDELFGNAEPDSGLEDEPGDSTESDLPASREGAAKAQLDDLFRKD